MSVPFLPHGLRHAARAAACALAVAAGTAGLTATPAAADTIASRVEGLGEMTYIKVSAMRATERGGRMLVQVRFTNQDNNDRAMSYRFKWLDKDQFSVWEDEPWKPLLIHGAQSVEVQSLAPTTQAADFRVEVHAADNSMPANSAPR